MLKYVVVLWALLVVTVVANTEKAIFKAPSKLQSILQHPTLEDLRLEQLTPQHGSLRTHIEAQFPNITSPKGLTSWYLIEGLTEGQRYEVRICWAATVPKRLVHCLEGFTDRL